MGSTKTTKKTKRSFTQRMIESLAPKEKRYNEPDAGARHLFVVVHPSGKKCFFHLAKAFDPTKGACVPRRTHLADVEDITIEGARAKAEELNSALATWRMNGYKGPDPLAKVERSAPARVPVFRELVEAYIVNHVREEANNPVKAEAHLRWQVKKYFGAWLDKRLDKITVEDVLAVKNACGEHRYMANRCVEVARCLFNWSAQTKDGKVRFWSTPNPAKDVGSFEEKQRKRFLQPDEVVWFDDALKNEKHRDLKDFLTLALSTGVRRSNIFSARWPDIQWERLTWCIPFSKNGESYDVQLLPAALETLKRRRALIPEGEEFVFPGIGASGHLIDLKKPWNAFRKRAGFPDVHLHDLRRTHGSYLAIAGVPLQQIKSALGHKSLQSTEVYAHLLDESVRGARESGQAKMQELTKKARKRLKLAERKPKFLTAVAR